MLVQAVIIFIVILIIANILLGVWNAYWPSCVDAVDYFNVSRVDSSRLDGLSSVVSKKPREISVGSYLDYHEMTFDEQQDKIQGKSLAEKINNMFTPNVPAQDTVKGVSDYDGSNAAVFEVEFEGIPANNAHHSDLKKERTPASRTAYSQRQDGYSDR